MGGRKIKRNISIEAEKKRKILVGSQTASRVEGRNGMGCLNTYS